MQDRYHGIKLREEVLYTMSQRAMYAGEHRYFLTALLHRLQSELSAQYNQDIPCAKQLLSLAGVLEGVADCGDSLSKKDYDKLYVELQSAMAGIAEHYARKVAEPV